MKPRTAALVIAGLSACLAAVTAEEKAKPAIGVLVSEITDLRTTASAGECRITLSLTGDAANDAHSVRTMRLHKAVDDLDRDLLKPGDQESFSLETAFGVPRLDEQRRLDAVAEEVTRRRMLREAAAGAIDASRNTAAPSSAPTAALALPPPRPILSSTLTSTLGARKPMIRLRNPSRQAAAIKLIEGEIELYTPTDANGGLLRLPNITTQPGEFVRSEPLERAGVKLMYVTPESYEAKRSAVGNESVDPAGPWTDEIGRSIKSLARYHDPRRASVLLFVHDPQQRVVDLELQEPKGIRLDTRGSTKLGAIRLLALEGPPPENAQLLVRLATDGALSRHAFKLENIAVP